MKCNLYLHFVNLIPRFICSNINKLRLINVDYNFAKPRLIIDLKSPCFKSHAFAPLWWIFFRPESCIVCVVAPRNR